MRRYRDFKEDLLQELKDPEHARLYLKIALEEFEKDQDEKLFLTALRDVAEAQGGLTKLSGKANLNRQNLYKSQLTTFLIQLRMSAFAVFLDWIPVKKNQETNRRREKDFRRFHARK